MEKKLALQQIETITDKLNKTDLHSNLVNYSIIIAILNGLDEIAKIEKIPMYQSYKKEFTNSLEAVCNLNDGNGHTFEQHLSWIRQALSKFKSVHCFDI